MKPYLRVISAFLTLFLLAGGVHLYRANLGVAPDYPTAAISASSPEVTVDIPNGATGSAIAQLLASSGVVKSSEALFRVFVGDARASRIAPGAHRLNLKISSQQALEQLLDVKRMPSVITIIEGAWNSEIIATLKDRGYSLASINQALAKVNLPAGFNTSEGLLFPAHYNFAKGTAIDVVLSTMVARGIEEAQKAGILDSSDRLKPMQLLTIASIIQQEGDVKDFPKISQVIRNRLAKGMPLQLDSTVHYIKKSRGTVFLSTESTFIRSPYNTYRRYGLPPAPIGNPGAAAMKAAVNPEPGVWLYFITVKPGDTRFTDSLDQFNTWKLEYQKNRKAGAFK